MATTDARTNEQILKAIKRMSEKIGGNKDDMQREKKDRQDLLKQESLLQERMMIIQEEQKKNMLKEKQTTMGLFSMIKFNANQYFDETKNNQITWGKLADNVKESVKDWFNASLKQRTILGATLRMGASLWKATHDHIISAVKNVFGKIGGQMREVLGELSDVFDTVWSLFKSGFNFIKDSVFGALANVPPADRYRNKMLQTLVNYFRRKEKRELIAMGGKGDTEEGGWGAVILRLIWWITAIGAGMVGALVRKFIIPFEVLFKTFNIGGAFKWIGAFFMKFEWVGKLLAPFIGVGGMVDKFVEITGALTRIFPKFAKLLSGLFGAFKVGFKVFGWPLQIIWSLIQFVRGFMGTEGTFLDKLKGGFKKMIDDFIGFPVRIVAWMIEGLAGLFGIKIEGLADKYLAWISNWIDFFVDLIFGPITNFITAFMGGKGTFLENLWAGIMAVFEGWGKMYDDYIKPIMNWLGIGGGDDEDVTDNGKKSITNSIEKGSVNKVSEAESNKAKAEAWWNTNMVVEATEKQTKDILDGGQKIAEDNQSNTQVAVKTGTTNAGTPYTVPELPEGIGARGFNSNESDF